MDICSLKWKEIISKRPDLDDTLGSEKLKAPFLIKGFHLTENKEREYKVFIIGWAFKVRGGWTM